jgi:hypothetical protein
MNAGAGVGLPPSDVATIPAWKNLTIQLDSCSGLHIGNKEDKGIIMTAAHCTEFDTRKNAKNPTLAIYSDNGGAKIEHVENLGYTNDTSYADAALLYTNTPKDISSVFLLENSEDLPHNTQLHYYGRASLFSFANKWTNNMHINDTDSRIKEAIDAILGDTYMNPNFFIGDQYNASKYKFYVRGCTTTIPLEQGDSGGPIGIPFGENKFAVVGLVQVGNFFTSISQCLITLLELNIKFNLATYNVKTGLIELNTELNREFHTKIDRIVELKTLLQNKTRAISELENSVRKLRTKKFLNKNITVTNNNINSADKKVTDEKELGKSRETELQQLHAELNKTLTDRLNNLEQIRMASMLAAPEPEPTLAAPKPEPTLAAPKPEPALAAPKPEPALAAPKPEPALAAPKPEPASALATPPKRSFCNRYFGCFRKTAKVHPFQKSSRKRSTRRQQRRSRR